MPLVLVCVHYKTTHDDVYSSDSERGINRIYRSWYVCAVAANRSARHSLLCDDVARYESCALSRVWVGCVCVCVCWLSACCWCATQQTGFRLNWNVCLARTIRAFRVSFSNTHTDTHAYSWLTATLRRPMTGRGGSVCGVRLGKLRI